MSPRTRCGVQCVSHPALRCGVHWRYSLDSASHRVTPHHDAGSRKVPLVGITFAGIPGYRVAPGHPAPRCGVQKSASCGYYLCRYSLPGYFWIPHQVRNDREHRITVRYDVVAGSREGPLVGIAFAGIPCPGISGFRVEHRVTPHHDAGSIGGYSWIPRRSAV